MRNAFCSTLELTLRLKFLPKATGSCNAISKMIRPTVFNDIFGITGLFVGLTKTTVKSRGTWKTVCIHWSGFK